jgi:hypothetical protein
MLHLKFLGAVWAASDDGNMERLLEYLRADGPLSAEDKSYLADYLDGKLKRSVGGQKKPRFVPKGGSLELYGAAHDVQRLKNVWRKRYGRRNPLQAEAIEMAAKRWGVSEGTLANYIRRAQK